MKDKQLVQHGQWAPWVACTNRFNFTCCDCGFSHRMQFKTRKGILYMRCGEDPVTTKEVREKKARKAS